MRRASTNERNRLGDPYKIYNEIQNVGKTYEGSKKRIRWVFGFTESQEEFEVTLTHSMVSGKRTIAENGREIVSSTNIMATDFSYGWDSPSTSRLFRIEAQSNVTTDNDYIFTIDGIRFDDLPNKPRKSFTGESTNQNSRYGNDFHVKRGSEHGHNSGHGSAHGGGHGSTHGGGTVAAAPSRKSTSSHDVTSRAQFQSPANKSKSGDDFDPFGPKNEAFDPFADNKTTQKSARFDPFATDSAPGSTTRHSAPAPSSNQSKTAAQSLFGNLEETPPKTNLKSSSFDAFGSDDPFTDNGSAANHHGNSDFGFEPFPADGANKKTTPTKMVAPPPSHQPIRKQSISSSQPDLLSSQPVVAPVGGAQRRSSAVEISMDFAGLSFETKSAAPAPVERQTPRDKPVAEQPEQPKEEENALDPWASKIVDLDLSGKTAPQRRASLQSNAGPSLNQMLSGPNQKRPSFGSSSTSNDPFGAPAILPLSNNNPVPVPVQPIKPLTSSQAISSLGPPAPMGGMGYAMPPAAPMGYQSGSHNMAMGYQQPPSQMPMGYPSAGGSMMAGNTNTRGSINLGSAPPPAMMSSTRGSFIGGMNQQPKSSLDNLDWKQFN